MTQQNRIILKHVILEAYHTLCIEMHIESFFMRDAPPVEIGANRFNVADVFFVSLHLINLNSVGFEKLLHDVAYL